MIDVHKVTRNDIVYLGESISKSGVSVPVDVVGERGLEGGGGRHEGQAHGQQLPAAQQRVPQRVLRRLPAQLHVQLVAQSAGDITHIIN